MPTDIKDGVEWRPWWVRYARLDGLNITLEDDALDAPRHRAHARSRRGRYFLGVWESLEDCLTCGEPNVLWVGGDGREAYQHSYDNLAEALAAFHAAEERLLAGTL